MRRLPPLTALPAFEATARLGSVSAAADELGRTHGAISKQLRNLAEDLGHPLFEKEGTGLKLTAAGQTYLPVVTKALEDLTEGWAQLRGTRPTEYIEIGLSSTLSQRWLLPRISAFYEKYPEIEVSQQMGLRTPLVPNDFTAHGTLTWDRLRFDIEDMTNFTSVGDAEFLLIHAPEYPVTIENGRVRAATRLVQQTTQNGWEKWQHLTNLVVDTDEVAVFPHTHLMLEAVAEGHGIALTERRLVQRDLDAGRLVTPLAALVFPGGFGITLADRGKSSPGCAAFIEWLKTLT